VLSDVGRGGGVLVVVLPGCLTIMACQQASIPYASQATGITDL
jgi:hypothetical protein